MAIVVAALALVVPTAGGSPAPVAAHEPPSVTIWCPCSGSGGTAETAALASVVARVQARYPEIAITVEDHGFPGVVNDFFGQAASGVPDLMTVPNDSLYREWQAGLIRDVTSTITPYLGSLRQQSVTGSTVDGRIVQIPESLKATALYFDKVALPEVPRTTGEYLAALRSGVKLGIVGAGGREPYYAYGFYGAFGGSIMNGAGRCIADGSPGVAAALAWLRDATTAGFVWFPNSATAMAALVAGDVAGYIDGNWAFGDVRAALGNRMGVVPGPAGPVGPFRPMVGVGGYVVNVASPNAAAAIKVALAMTDRAAQTTFMEVAGHVPADGTIEITDARIAAFAEASDDGVLRPMGPYLDNYWGPFGGAFNDVVYGGADPAAAVSAACSAMNAANRRPDGRIRLGTSGAYVGNNVYNTTGAGQSKTGSAKKGKTITFGISIQNDGTGADRFTVKATGTAAGAYTVKYFSGSTDITAKVVAGTYRTPSLAPGAASLVTAKVTVKMTAPAGSKVTRLVTITSAGSSTKKDAVKLIAKRS
jgi:arabinogalactan oligomer/maltooligosaccharide transport system substrate-binding protein